MSWQAWATIAVVFGAMLLFASEKLRIDLVALIVLGTLVVLGIVVLLAIERKWRRSKSLRADGTTVTRIAPTAWRLQWGRMLGLYLIWYGLGRSYLESIRIDPSEIFFGIRTNIWAAFAAILLGIVSIIVQGRRHPGLEPSPYLPGREWLPDRVVHSENYYSDTDDDGDGAAPSKTPAAANR